MKKIFTLALVLCATLSMQAAFHLSINQLINDEEIASQFKTLLGQ